jgi:hypothetical protein
LIGINRATVVNIENWRQRLAWRRSRRLALRVGFGGYVRQAFVIRFLFISLIFKDLRFASKTIWLFVKNNCQKTWQIVNLALSLYHQTARQ